MKTMSYAEFAELPEGVIFEFERVPAYHMPGMHRKGRTWPEDADHHGGISSLNLSYAIEYGLTPEDADAGGRMEFLEDWRGKDRGFRVYEPADLDRLAGLIGRGLAAQQEGGSPC